jgi:hypothetical protein
MLEQRQSNGDDIIDINETNDNNDDEDDEIFLNADDTDK